MNWINNVVRPKIRSFLNKKDTPDNLWVKCPESGEMVFYKDLEANQWVVPGSGHHMKIKADDRLASFMDGGIYDPLPEPDVVQDPLKFRDLKKYSDRLRDNRNKTGTNDAILAAEGHVQGHKIMAIVQDFEFMAGSLGLAAGEAIVNAMLAAVERKLPVVMFCASGGARMQEGVLSLMQMPRTTVAVQRLKKAGLPFIVVLTNPTTGGVTASYAMLGDVHIAEPGAQIGFAGARVIEQTIRETLPEGFQRAEYLNEHGMVDMVVHRHNLRDVIGNLVSIFTKAEVKQVAPAKLPDPQSTQVRTSSNENVDDVVLPEAAHAE